MSQYRCAAGPPSKTSPQEKDDCCRKPSEFPENLIKACAKSQVFQNAYSNTNQKNQYGKFNQQGRQNQGRQQNSFGRQNQGQSKASANVSKKQDYR